MGKSRQDSVLAVTCIFPVIAALFVGARTVSRHIGHNFWWDDWLIHLSLFLLLWQTITLYEYMLASNTGYHSTDQPKHSVKSQVSALKWSFAAQIFYHPLMSAIRASIIMFLFRMKDTRWHVRWALRTVFCINVGYLISTTAANIFQCDPVKYAYSKPAMDHKDADGNIIAGGKCINSREFIMVSCALSIFMDLIIIPIPTVMVWGLQMKRRTKIAVVAVMSMGWLATIASVSRLIVYDHRYAPNTDRTYDIGLISSVVEPSVGIIAACAPALRRLFTLMMPQYFSDDTYTCTNIQAANMHARPGRSHSLPIDKEAGTDNMSIAEEDIDVTEIGDVTAFTLKNLEGGGSREAVHSDSTVERTQSVKTDASETSNPYSGTEPLDVLNQRR